MSGWSAIKATTVPCYGVPPRTRGTVTDYTSNRRSFHPKITDKLSSCKNALLRFTKQLSLFCKIHWSTVLAADEEKKKPKAPPYCLCLCTAARNKNNHRGCLNLSPERSGHSSNRINIPHVTGCFNAFTTVLEGNKTKHSACMCVYMWSSLLADEASTEYGSLTRLMDWVSAGWTGTSWDEIFLKTGVFRSFTCREKLFRDIYFPRLGCFFQNRIEGYKKKKKKKCMFFASSFFRLLWLDLHTPHKLSRKNGGDIYYPSPGEVGGGCRK